MRSVATLMLVVLVCVVTAAEAQQKPPAPPEKGTRIYQTDKYGNVQHNKPSWVVKENGLNRPGIRRHLGAILHGDEGGVNECEAVYGRLQG